MNENEQLLYQLGLFQPSESTRVPVTKYRSPTLESAANKLINATKLRRTNQPIITADTRSTWLKLESDKQVKETDERRQRLKNTENFWKATTGLMNVPLVAYNAATGNWKQTGTGSTIGDIAVFAGPGLLSLGRNVGRMALNTVSAYKNVIPLMITKAKNFNGSSKVSRGIKNISYIATHPSMVKTLNTSPELIQHFPIYSFRDFTPSLMKLFQSVWSRESAKGPYSREGILKYATDPKDIETLPNSFEKARDLYNAEQVTKRYGKMLGNQYHKMYLSIIDPDLRHIVDVSPQYMLEVYQYSVNPRNISKETFIKDLINKSNSYRRFMNFDATPELFATFGGRGLLETKGALINVEGLIRSDFNGEYGRYPGYYLGKPELTGPISTWWDQRMPKEVNINKGLHSEQPYITKLIRKYNNNDSSLHLISELVKSYNSTNAPWNFFNYPTHQVFSGPKGTILPNFEVTTKTPPIGFLWGKGYKKGGKL